LEAEETEVRRDKVEEDGQEEEIEKEASAERTKKDGG
jgi:hypothetical protein